MAEVALSNEEKRSGIRDIRTLRERLGKMKQASAKPSDAVPEDDPQTVQSVPLSAPTADDNNDTSLHDASIDNSQSFDQEPPVQKNTAAFSSSVARQSTETGIPQSQPSGIDPMRATSPYGSDPKQSNFVHPLQAGNYKPAEANNSLTPADRAELDEYNQKHSGRTKLLAIVGGAGIVLGLLFGYLSGSASDARARFNLSIDVAL